MKPIYHLISSIALAVYIEKLIKVFYIRKQMGLPLIPKHRLGKLLNFAYHPVQVLFERNQSQIQRLKYAGYFEKHQLLGLIYWQYILPPSLMLLLIFSNKISLATGLIVILPYCLSELNIRLLIRKRNHVFEKNAYKIYKYLYNQVSSGVRVSDGIKSVYLSVNDPSLKNTLMRFSARYIQTMNIDYALEVLREAYSCFEMDSFCGAIKQGIETGDNADLLKKQEETMFNKYFMSIQKDTDIYKWKITFIVFIQCMILIMMVGIPLLMDLNRALDKILMS